MPSHVGVCFQTENKIPQFSVALLSSFLVWILISCSLLQLAVSKKGKNMVNCFLTDEYILSFKLEKCIACFPFFKNETVTWSLIDNNCVITRISPCALDVLMAGALCQDQLLLLCPCPCTPCSSQAASIPVLPIWHSC